MANPTTVHVEMPIGIVIRKMPGITRWARWHWRAVAVLPGAGPASWVELRREGEAVEYHAATLTLTLWAPDTEAYVVNLADTVPSIYVVMRAEGALDSPPTPVIVTASPYEAQDYCDSGEEIVEKVPMSAGLLGWVNEFTQTHHRDEAFVKRRRDKQRVDFSEDGKGDARIRQISDVFRAPRRVEP